MKKEENLGFTMIELATVIAVFAMIVATTFIASSLVKSARFANAVNLTAQANFSDDDRLILWLETSQFNDEKSGTKIDSWTDYSRNSLVFEPVASGGFAKVDSNLAIPTTNGLLFRNSSFKSDSVVGLNKFTAFVVAIPINNNSNRVVSWQFNVTGTNLVSPDYVYIMRYKNNKYQDKNGFNKSFSAEKSYSLSLPNGSGMNKIYIGGSSSSYFIGTIYEVIIFNDYLSDKEVEDIEYYLQKKYKR